MTVEEMLKSAGVQDEVIAGLPKDVVGHISTYITTADTKLQGATEAQQKADEALRQAGLEKKDVEEYVKNYGTSLTKMSSVEAKNKALVTYIKTLKDQGFDIPAELVTEAAAGGKPVVPGSPAIGGNAIDEGKLLGKVGDVLSQWMDANNEHLRLYGTPIPDGSTVLANEATQARKPIGQYIAEKFKFAAKKEEKNQADAKAREEQIRKEEREKVQREFAERTGSNPNLVSGEASRNSFVTKIKSDEFHKADGSQPERERRARMLERIHADVQTARSA